MQAQRYFLLVNDQQLDQVIAFEEDTIISFINEHIQPGQDNKLTFYRTIKWLDGDSNTVLKEDKEVILESSATAKIEGNHEIVQKITEWQEMLRNLQAAIFNAQPVAQLGARGKIYE